MGERDEKLHPSYNDVFNNDTGSCRRDETRVYAVLTIQSNQKNTRREYKRKWQEIVCNIKLSKHNDDKINKATRMPLSS